jgi:hypothetical protein
VTGAKYESCTSDASEGVGDGDMTRGVAGIGYGYDIVICPGRPRQCMGCGAAAAASGSLVEMSQRVKGVNHTQSGYSIVSVANVTRLGSDIFQSHLYRISVHREAGQIL